MLSRLSRPAHVASLPTTYLLLSDDLVLERQAGFGWSDALDALWTGDYDGTPRLYEADFAAGTLLESPNAALIDLADRAHLEGEAPRHLWSLFDAAGLDYPTERLPGRHESLTNGFIRVGTTFAGV